MSASTELDEFKALMQDWADRANADGSRANLDKIGEEIGAYIKANKKPEPEKKPCSQCGELWKDGVLVHRIWCPDKPIFYEPLTVPGISKTLDEVCEKAIDFMVAIRPEVLSTKNPKVMSTAHELMTTINNSGYYKCPICKKPMKELPRVDTPVHITVCQDKDCIHKQLLAAEVKKA